MSIETDIRGLDALHRQIDEYQSRAGDITPITPVIHRLLIERIKAAFRTQGVSQGRKWPGYQNEPRYRGYKRKRASALTVLRWIGGDYPERLYPSMTQATHPEHVWRQVGNRISFGTRVPYARRLERGGKNFFGESAPPREFARLGDDGKVALAQILGRWVVTGKVGG